jgi:hypothetical protein
MPLRWLYDKQPDENGNFTLQIETTSGARVSTFTGKSIEEVAERAAASQEEANITISNLRRPDTGKQGIRIQPPREVSPADRLRLSTEITDPYRVVEAVEEIVTARQGISPDKAGAEFARMSNQEQSAYYLEEAQAFAAANPDYYGVPQNSDALFKELFTNKWPITRNNLALAFERLKARGEMIPWPSPNADEEESEELETVPPQPRYTNGHTNEPPNGRTAQPAPAPRPRSISTGIRNTDATALPPPPVRKAKYTRADVENMSRAEYNEKVQNDPEFRRQVDAMS